MLENGSGEIRAEIERLQNASESLQKLNLRLEAENLELKLDLEKIGKDAPHLREQIQHLENYIEVLKSENEAKHVVCESGDHSEVKADKKKLSELERTVFVLKRVVEKLQVENKRLQSGSTRACTSSARPGSPHKLRIDHQRLKEKYEESLQKVIDLEVQLKIANEKLFGFEDKKNITTVATLSDELSRVKEELSHKSQLLNKIKILLHRAAIKEKSLLEQIATLKLMVPSEVQSSENSVD